MENHIILSVQDLDVKFTLRGQTLHAIRGVSLDVYEGESLAIVGESGSGKSVFVKTFMGLLDGNGSIHGGSIVYHGQDLTQCRTDKDWLKIRGREIAMVLQDPMTSLNPLKTIGAQIQEAVELHQGLKGNAAKQAVLEVLSDVGIDDPQRRYKQYPHEFSGGMRQRVVIAIAVACRPKILICDEPTTALDVTIQAQILKLMNDLKAQMGTSILFITHDLGVIHEMADEVAVMYCGQIVEKAPARTIFHDGTYSHPYTEGLMTSIPQLNTPKGEKLDAIPGSVPNPLYLPQGCKFGPRCKYCTKRCEEAEPPLQEVEPGHVVRCFYAEKAVRKEHGE